VTRSLDSILVELVQAWRDRLSSGAAQVAA
jgi:hypothetical protein